MIMITSVYQCLKYVVIPFVNLYNEFLNKLLPLACFGLNGKKAMLSLITKKATNKTLKITVQFLYFLSPENLLKDSYLVKCLVFFPANNLRF